MSYKTILTVLTNSSQVKATIAIAAGVARREGAHLDVLCLGVDQTPVGAFYPGASAMLLDQTMKAAQEDAKALDTAARTALELHDIRWAVESGAAQVGGLSNLVAERARFCDLVVQPQPSPDAASRDGEVVIEAALFDGQVPVLVVPPAGLAENFAEHIVLAWNQSNEAMRAIRSALPLMKAARLVTIAIIDPPQHGPERSDPGGALSQLLARHGVHAEVVVLAKTLPRVSEVLNRLVLERGAGMVVMGAYGHSRLRESILGGATRGMLDKAAVPVFMAH